MNWHANQIREDVKKLNSDYEDRLALLTQASLDVQNYLSLEEQLEKTTSNLKAAEQNLTKAKTEAEQQLKVKEKELKEQEAQITKLEKKIASSKELIFNLRKEIRELNSYHSRNLRNNSQSTKEELSQIKSLATDQQRELQSRGKLIITLEEQALESQKELDFANSKIKQLNPLFSQVLTVIKKNVILREKSKLKEAIANIQELMEWEKSPLVTETNTPTGEAEE